MKVLPRTSSANCARPHSDPVRTIFVNRFYWPDEPATAQLLTDLAEALAARGHDIVVIASHPGRADVPRTETRHGVRIVRVRSSRGGGAGFAGKALDFATFLGASIGQLLRTARRGDTLVAMTDPPLLAIGAWAVAGLRRARLIQWVQDIYPELAVELSGQRWLRLLLPLRNLAWCRADAGVTLGTDMAAVLVAAGVDRRKISVIANWAPAGLAPQPVGAADALRAEWGLAGKFVVAYSGNLGRVHDLAPVLALAAALGHDAGIAFVFIGAGAQRAALEAEAARLGLGHVQFRPAQPRARLAETLALGDAHLVTLRPGCERYVFPSKLSGVAAVGRPVIFIGPHQSELAQLVTGRGLGLAFDRTETTATAAAIRTLAASAADCARFGAAAARFAAESGGLDAAAARWHALLAPAKAC